MLLGWFEMCSLIINVETLAKCAVKGDLQLAAVLIKKVSLRTETHEK